MLLILNIHEIIYTSLKLIIPSEAARREAPRSDVYNLVTREALAFPTSITRKAWFSRCYKSIEFGWCPPRLANKSSSIIFTFSAAKAGKRAGARLVSAAKNSTKWRHFGAIYLRPCRVCRRELSKCQNKSEPWIAEGTTFWILTSLP